MVPKNAQKPPNFKRLLVPKRAHLHWAQDQGEMGKATFDVDVRGDFDKNRCRQMPPLLAPGLALMASLVAKSV